MKVKFIIDQPGGYDGPKMSKASLIRSMEHLPDDAKLTGAAINSTGTYLTFEYQVEHGMRVLVPGKDDNESDSQTA